MFSATGYQLYGDMPFEYAGTEEYKGNEYFKYSSTDTNYILTPTRNITKVTFPFDDYYFHADGNEGILPLTGFDSIYGFASVPENKILMKRRTDIGTNANGKDYVDLGLTSGTLWATCNVGATSETDYGYKFQWAETTTDTDYSWATYKYCNGSSPTLTKYCTDSSYGTVDNKTTLDLEDDAARVNMGGDWRMPTNALMEELVEETTNEWIKGYNGSGKNGYKFTSKINGNSIFIPAPGGIGGSVWSSSLDNGISYSAWELHFNSDGIGANYQTARFNGQSVRGVL